MGKYISPEQVRKLLGLDDINTVYTWLKNGTIPVHIRRKIGGRWFIDAQAFDKWMKSSDDIDV